MILVIGFIFVVGFFLVLVVLCMEDFVLCGCVVNINMIYLGVDVECVELLIIEKIEDELLDIDEIKEICFFS